MHRALGWVASLVLDRIGLWEGTALAIADGILVAAAVGWTSGHWLEGAGVGSCVTGIAISGLAWRTWHVAIRAEREANDRLDRALALELRAMGIIGFAAGRAMRARLHPGIPPGILIPMRRPRPGRRPN